MRIQDFPPELPDSGADSIYSYENLPSKHQKKYVYASRFVQLARAKTPKITYYSTKAKCDLMENMENFEVSFYDGQKIVRTSENNVRIFDSTGSMIAMNGEHDSVQTLWQHYQQSFEHCKSLERALSNIHSDGKECFPIIVGRNQAKATNSTDSRNNTNNILSPRLAGVSKAKQNQFFSEINRKNFTIAGINANVIEQCDINESITSKIIACFPCIKRKSNCAWNWSCVPFAGRCC